ncbi:Mg2+ and Co2+ transporter [Corallococcus coralloides DSM 2259]|uniref:Mg2+ and Co2+ transporter n=1 Tax=Corallococcus coralloides (strain ATCC 25202 / DSM 2259 / NBRC 100086 / M2) TaxID=1144275 RepID=H8MT02_CORCM|nr:CorA family divalent cation transporter [Corallococcus coralloides]AFE11208.1 Mg2+ and Co2+ transporter [Corallococcus coralloides DSM 2259]
MDGFENAFALLLDGSGGARSLSLEETRRWRASDGMLWVHLPPDLPDLPRVLEAVFHLPPQVREPLLADTGRVRIDVLNENELVLLLLHPDPAPTNMAFPRQLRAWMTADRCVTVAPTNQPAIVAVREQLAHGRGPRGTDLFLAFATTALSTASLRATELDDALSGLETRFEARREDSGDVPTDLRRLRRTLVEQRRFVSLVRDAILRVSLLSVEWVRAQERELRQMAERAGGALKEMDALVERARILHEDVKARLDARSQRILYMLTIISGVFLPLSFITGLLGVNVAGIPGARWRGSFLLLVLVLIVLAAAEWRALRRRELV